MVPGELTLHDLPPIEDLKITLDEKVTLSAIGNVESVVDCLGKYDEINLFMYSSEQVELCNNCKK